MSEIPSTRVLVVPSAPLLLVNSTGQRVPSEVHELRTAVTSAIDWLLEDDRAIVVLGAGESREWLATALSADEIGMHWSGTLGVPQRLDPPRSDYPTSLMVAAQYAGSRVHRAFTTDGTAPPVNLRGLSVLIVGSGSARRRDGAPGYIDDRAIPFDEQTATALRTGDIELLRGRDPQLADQLLDDVCAPLRAAAEILDAPQSAFLDYCDDPFGVAYFVARWQI